MTDQPITDQQLDEYDELCAAATPGPWAHTDSSAIVAPISADKIADVWEPTGLSRNGDFIETARAAMPALIAEVRRLQAELAAARTAAFVEAEKEIATAIDWNRAEYPAVGGMITRRLGMRAAERVVRGLREEAEGGCPGFEGNPVAPDLCAGCHEPRDTHAAPAAPAAASAAGESGSTR